MNCLLSIICNSGKIRTCFIRSPFKIQDERNHHEHLKMCEFCVCDIIILKNHRGCFPSPQVFADVANYPSRGQGQRIHNNNSGLERKHRSTHPAGDSEQGRRMHLDRCFSCFDVLERGRVPSGVVWGGLALLTGASELGKIKFVLGMYDANRWAPTIPYIMLSIYVYARSS